MTILESLFALRDEKNAAFQSKLTPNLPAEQFLGVRVPDARKLAKACYGSPEAAAFLEELPHRYFDENMLHGLLISEERDASACFCQLDRFLPYIDNWAVCDILSPKVFRKTKPELLKRIYQWTGSEHPYTCRFGLEMLMSHFLDADFSPEYLELPASVHSEAYYVNMMIAWLFATALAKQWDAALPYLLENRLPPWVHNKTIQKACESRRICPEQKQYLRSLKRMAAKQELEVDNR